MFLFRRSSWCVLVFLVICAPDARAEELWLELLVTPHLSEAQAAARILNPRWIEGGRLASVVIRRQESCARASVCYRVLVGIYPGLVKALSKGIEILHLKPWARLGFAPRSIRVVGAVGFAPLPVRFDSALAKALRPSPDADFPAVAETLCSRVHGFLRPEPVVPPLDRHTVVMGAWDRLLLLESRELCMETPRIVGGPPPKRQPGQTKPGPNQTHQAGRRCLLWYRGLAEKEMTMAWFPAFMVARTKKFRKASTTTRWGPVTYRYVLNRVGRLPGFILYDAVFRTGAFTPIRLPVTVADRFPLPHRLGWDRLGPAVFEGNGLIVRRLTIHPPSRRSPLWKESARRPPGYRYVPSKGSGGKKTARPAGGAAAPGRSPTLGRMNRKPGRRSAH